MKTLSIKNRFFLIPTILLSLLFGSCGSEKSSQNSPITQKVKAAPAWLKTALISNFDLDSARHQSPENSLSQAKQLKQLGFSAVILSSGNPFSHFSKTPQIDALSLVIKSIQSTGIRVLLSANLNPIFADTSALKQFLQQTSIDGFLINDDSENLIRWQSINQFLIKTNPEIAILFNGSDVSALKYGFHAVWDQPLVDKLIGIRTKHKRTSSAINLLEQSKLNWGMHPPLIHFLENNHQQNLSVIGKEALESYNGFLLSLPGMIYLPQNQFLASSQSDAGFYARIQRWLEIREQYSFITNGEFIPLQTSMVNGAAAAFLRVDDSGMALIICNLRRDTAEKVLIIPQAEIKKRIGNVTFKKLDDPAQKINLDRIYFEVFYPFTTEIYVSENNQLKK